MKRTDADGNVSNRFFDGNPTLGQAATVIEETWLNNVQEEISNVVEDAGITLSGGDENQLLEALDILISQGGTSTGAIADFTIANNISSATDVTGLLFNSANVRSAIIMVDIHREDDGPVEADEIGELAVVYDSVNSVWRSSFRSFFDDAGVSFSITAAGQVQYTSSNFTGGAYTGTLKMKHTRSIPV